MIIEGIKRTRIVANDSHRGQIANLARRVRVLRTAGLSIHRIAIKLGISRLVVARTLPWLQLLV
jgi:hypothetical protein